MKLFLNLLIICLFFLSCDSNNHESDKKQYNITEKQIEYAQSLHNNSLVLSARWKDFKNLEVIVKPEKLGKNDDNDNDILIGQLLADAIATKGHEYVGKNICVSILYPDNEEVGSACVKNE